MDIDKALQEYINNTKPYNRKSRLEPYKDAILELKNKGYSYQQILDFLVSLDVKVSLSTLQSFLKVRTKEKKVDKQKPVPTPTKAPVVLSEDIQKAVVEKPKNTQDKPISEGDAKKIMSMVKELGFSG